MLNEDISCYVLESHDCLCFSSSSRQILEENLQKCTRLGQVKKGSAFLWITQLEGKTCSNAQGWNKGKRISLSYGLLMPIFSIMYIKIDIGSFLVLPINEKLNMLQYTSTESLDR